MQARVGIIASSSLRNLRSGRRAQIDANRLCLRCMTLDHSGSDVARNLEQGSLPRVGIGQTVLERHIGGNRRHFRYRVGESRFQITSQAPGRPAPRAACMTRSRPSAHELLDDLREAHLALDQGHGATLELDPTLVESVEHLDAGNRITHSLGRERSRPSARAERPLREPDDAAPLRTPLRSRFGSPTPVPRAR